MNSGKERCKVKNNNIKKSTTIKYPLFDGKEMITGKSAIILVIKIKDWVFILPI